MKAESGLHNRRNNRSEKRTDVDAHVKQIVGAILEVTARRIEVADHCGDVGLEEAVADHEAGEGEVDDGQRAEREEQVSGDEEDAADHDGTAKAEPPVRQKTTYQRASVDEH